MTAHFQRGAVLVEQQRHREAIAELQRHVLEVPQDARAHSLISLCLVALNRNSEAAERARAAIALDPEAAFGYSALATVLLAQEKVIEAHDAAREAVRLAPEDADYHGLLAQVLMLRGRSQEALAAAAQGLAIDPEHLACHHARDLVLMRQGRAAHEFGAALAIDPDDDRSHCIAGYAELQRGRPAESLRHFREAMRLDPNSDMNRRGLVEAMKAQNGVYRLLFRCHLWLARLGSRRNWAMQVGGVLLGQVGFAAAWRASEFSLERFLFLAGYVALLTAIWVGPFFFNLRLWLDRWGSQVLSDREKQGAVWLAAGGAVIILLLILGIGSGSTKALWAAVDGGMLLLIGTLAARARATLIRHCARATAVALILKCAVETVQAWVEWRGAPPAVEGFPLEEMWFCLQGGAFILLAALWGMPWVHGAMAAAKMRRSTSGTR